MIQFTFFRFIGTVGFLSVALGSISFWVLRDASESSSSDIRKNLIQFVAQTIETAPDYSLAFQSLHQGSGHRLLGLNLWVVGPAGNVIASNNEAQLPLSWGDLKKPYEIHDFSFRYDFLKLYPHFALVRLNGAEQNYLLVEFRRSNTIRGIAWLPVAFIFFVFGVSLALAGGLVYFYLKSKSKEARVVLNRLEKGDLKARFEIKGFDEIGDLMSDFNRMASEIERLVNRVQQTETARKYLLEELSHDLRTPLTSLNTSVETLGDHWSEMGDDKRREFISIVRSELGYFIHLIEDLFFIAAMGEPRYKKAAHSMNLNEMARAEVRTREKVGFRSLGKGVSWSFASDSSFATDYRVLGDPLLIQRLINNALDNAHFHARTRVLVRITANENEVHLSVTDDGLGISNDMIEHFGERRSNRIAGELPTQGVSLGLGSYIMKTIVELHGGRLLVCRKMDSAQQCTGTQLDLYLPKMHELSV